MDKIRDRGTKKWTAMMLPEHVELLRGWLAEDHYVERPAYEEWELELLQDEIQLAEASKSIVHIQTWKEGVVTSYQGKIIELNIESRQIILQDPFSIERLKVDDIIKVQSIT
ncbi:YolD-like family protein [Sporosarcina pasteurii]|uniref:YolD-like protein n=1 Tax=Sporosarcina pasteurii TaxID=1474 RepID=A0A380BSQ6_SPOPA|nr:YolD-like family protein [Sporosarcina pasteurii]MDS9471265.1 YolD-like family protein [Sporosarcina pasteurii]QBQ05103.1 YolD-like family protein [Sporosarcina pasteurii]SUJ06518.1 YolD-like protein [Sporosarcina pasteurii]